MTRMSREFSLVLLGSGILTAGYFLAPDPADAMADKADRQTADRVAANEQNRHHYYGGHYFLWAHSAGYTSRYGGGTSAMTGVSRGGFGGFGHASGGGG